MFGYTLATVFDWLDQHNGSVLAGATVLLVLVTLYYAGKTREANKLTREVMDRSGLIEVSRLLQSDEVVGARGKLFGTPVELERGSRYFQIAETVARNFQTIGYLVENDLIPRDLVLSNWGHTVIDAYEHARPMIEYRRTNDERPDPDLFGAFERLHDAALKIEG
jgi:hypothetical protein